MKLKRKRHEGRARENLGQEKLELREKARERETGRGLVGGTGTESGNERTRGGAGEKMVVEGAGMR